MSNSSNRPHPAPAWLIMMSVLVLDQLTKTLVRINMELNESLPLLKGIFGDTFMLAHVHNTGAAFSIGFKSDLVNRWFFIVTTILAVAFIIYLLYKAEHRLQVVSFGLVLGGAIGNLIDRIIYGGVTDFFSADFPDFIMQRFPIFNVADSCIFIGVCLLMIDMIFIKDTPPAPLTEVIADPDPSEINTKEI